MHTAIKSKEIQTLTRQILNREKRIDNIRHTVTRDRRTFFSFFTWLNLQTNAYRNLLAISLVTTDILNYKYNLSSVLAEVTIMPCSVVRYNGVTYLATPNSSLMQQGTMDLLRKVTSCLSPECGMKKNFNYLGGNLKKHRKFLFLPLLFFLSRDSCVSNRHQRPVFAYN